MSIEAYGFYFPGRAEAANTPATADVTRFQEWINAHGVTAVVFCTSGAAPKPEEVAGLPIAYDPPLPQRRGGYVYREYVFTSASDAQIMAWLRHVGGEVIVCGGRHAPLLSLEIYNDYRE